MENMEQMGGGVQDEKRIEKIVTHEGIFHTDEVFGEAILKDLFPESMELKAGGKIDFVKYIRTRDKNIIEKAKKSDTTMVIDTGGENDFDKFNMDHHQIEGAGARENGVEYATAGLVWKNYGREWIKYVDVYSRDAEKGRLSEEEIDLIWNRIDGNYVQLIDCRDTGQLKDITVTLDNGQTLPGEQFTMAEVVRLSNVDIHDGRNQQQRFDGAVELLRSLMLSAVNKEMDLVEGLRKFSLEKCLFIGDRRAVIIDQPLNPVVTAYVIDTKEALKDVEYYAVRNSNGAYSVMVAPVAQGSREHRNPNMIPTELRVGNNTKEINQLLGVKDGVTFSHSAGFFASCKNLDTATKFLEYCIKK